MWWLWIILLALIVFLFYDIGERYRHQYILNLQNTKTFEGNYMNHDKSERSTITKYQETYRWHRQGTSSIMDTSWIRSGTNQYTSDQGRAELEGDTIRLYNHDTLMATFSRMTEYCKVRITPVPTDDNCKKYYDTVMVTPSDQEELSIVLSKKRYCATLNDWNLNTSIVMAKGVFVLDHEKTCFYYVSNDRLTILQHRTEIIPRLASIDEFYDRDFMGAMM